MMFFPYRRTAKRYRGVGYEAPDIDLETVRGFLVSFMHKIRRSRQVPLVWHLSQAAALSWKRVVHVLCPFGNAFISTCISPHEKDEEPPSSHGCVPRRRRETLLMAQQALGWRLHRLGFEFVNGHKGITNAFGSTSWESLARANTE
eukprot:1301867-Pyramimonas_sp.AAC.1